MNDLEEIFGRDLKNLEQSALHRIRDFLDPRLCIHTLIDVFATGIAISPFRVRPCRAESMQRFDCQCDALAAADA